MNKALLIITCGIFLNSECFAQSSWRFTRVAPEQLGVIAYAGARVTSPNVPNEVEYDFTEDSGEVIAVNGGTASASNNMEPGTGSAMATTRQRL